MFPVIDMHCDTVSYALLRDLHAAAGGGTTVWGRDAWFTREELENGVSLRENTRMVDLKRMKEADYLCQSFALYTNRAQIERAGANAFEYVCALSDKLDRMLAENDDLILPARSASEILRNREAGRMSALKTVEEGWVYEGRLENLEELYRRGVRKSTLTWNFPNELAFPNATGAGPDGNPRMLPDVEHGLTETGFAFIEAMEYLGILIDVSHLNDAGIWDILKTVRTSTPVIASHSNARGVCDHPRNLTDEMLRAIADRGGVAGLNFCPAFLNGRYIDAKREADCESRIEDMLTHLRHIRRVAGIDTAALGTDFDGIGGRLELGSCGDMQRLAEAMERDGFTVEEIEKVFYQNALRVYRDVLG